MLPGLVPDTQRVAQALALVEEPMDLATLQAATGLGPHAVLIDPDDLDSISPPDDALASGWYRARILPRLVANALEAAA